MIIVISPLILQINFFKAFMLQEEIQSKIHVIFSISVITDGANSQAG